MTDVLQMILFTAIAPPLAYLALLSALGCLAREPRDTPAGIRRRFAILVPAYNEESCIADTLKSLRGIVYPQGTFDIVVIADNCTDRTAAIARGTGARVLERSSADKRSKGHALQWAFAQLLREPYDAFLVCDADTVVSENVLEVMHRAMDRGAGAVQCRDLVKPAPGVWSSEATRAGFVLYNVARPLGRMVLGCSVGLRGNGMGFTASTLRAHPWSAFSRAEDLEFGLELLLHGAKVHFAPGASVLASMPAQAHNAESQRARWEGGRYPVIRRFGWPLLFAAIRRRSFVLLDAWIDLMTPPFTNLMALALGAAAVNGVALVTGIAGDPLFTLLWSGAVFAGLLHVVLGFAAAGMLRELGSLLRHVPRYALWKLRLYGRLALVHDQKSWVRTTREREV